MGGNNGREVGRQRGKWAVKVREENMKVTFKEIDEGERWNLHGKWHGERNVRRWYGKRMGR